MSRALSLVVVSLYLAAAISEGDVNILVKTVIYVIFGLACIWFPDVMGSATSFAIRRPSPPALVPAVGWLLLVGIPILILLTTLAVS